MTGSKDLDAVLFFNEPYLHLLLLSEDTKVYRSAELVHVDFLANRICHIVRPTENHDINVRWCR